MWVILPCQLSPLLPVNVVNGPSIRHRALCHWYTLTPKKCSLFMLKFTFMKKSMNWGKVVKCYELSFIFILYLIILKSLLFFLVLLLSCEVQIATHGKQSALRPHGKWQSICKLKSPASQESVCRQWLCHQSRQDLDHSPVQVTPSPFCLEPANRD